MSLNRLLRLAAALLIAPGPAFSQTWPAGFPLDSFEVNATIASWLAAYDRVAWVTSDSVAALPAAERAGLAEEWFCIQQGEGWRAVYGALDSASGTYRSVVEFLRSDSVIRRAPDRLDPHVAGGYGRALRLTRAALRSRLTERAPIHNSYIRRGPDGRYEVWYLPAWQPNGVLVLGTQYRYLTDSAARTIAHEEIRQAGSWRPGRAANATSSSKRVTAKFRPSVSSSSCWRMAGRSENSTSKPGAFGRP